LKYISYNTKTLIRLDLFLSIFREMYSMKKIIYISFLFVFNTLFAQDTIHFEKALMVASNSRYGREAIYTDMLAWKKEIQFYGKK
jgi:hypothetical protein